jgi:hypothetical protein
MKPDSNHKLRFICTVLAIFGGFLQLSAQEETLQSVTNRGNITSNGLRVNSSLDVGDAYDPSRYGFLQIARPADQGNLFHISLIRSGNMIYGLGLLKNSSTFGLQPGSSNVTTEGLFMLPGGNIGISNQNPAFKLDVGGDIRSTGSLYVSSNNATGGGIKLEDDGDIVDMNDGWGTHRFSYGIRITSANGGGNPVIQLSNNNINPTYFNAGNVGIGTNTPAGLLHLNGTYATTDGGNSYPISGTGLVVQANTGGRISDRGAQIEFVVPASVDGGNPWGQGSIITVAGNNNNGDATGKMILGTRRSFNKNGKPSEWFYGDDIIIAGNGNVGVNTLNPIEKLTVNGKIKAKEIRVDGQDMPDYVFEKDYKVTTLEELESYIKENKHLPEIPDAIEAKKNGLKLGEMNKLLLKKVEELTLYIIEEHKLNLERDGLLDAQRLKIVELEKKIKSLNK